MARWYVCACTNAVRWKSCGVWQVGNTVPQVLPRTWAVDVPGRSEDACRQRCVLPGPGADRRHPPGLSRLLEGKTACQRDRRECPRWPLAPSDQLLARGETRPRRGPFARHPGCTTRGTCTARACLGPACRAHLLVTDARLLARDGR